MDEHAISDPDRPCPCGSGERLRGCCGLYLAGGAAPTAEVLMRSRFTANVLGDADYLCRSWHPDTRPTALDLADAPAWQSLEIRRTEGGGPMDDTGVVEFIARYRQRGREGALHETSRFQRVDGLWYYRDGEVHPEPAPTPRNAPCPCGSGRKYKRCCAGG